MGRIADADARLKAHLARGGLICFQWGYPPVDAAGWQRERWDGIDRAINRRAGFHAANQSDPALLRDRDRLRYPRAHVRIYAFETRWFQRRYGHLCASLND